MPAKIIAFVWRKMINESASIMIIKHSLKGSSVSYLISDAS